MSYRGFITPEKHKELIKIIKSISDNRGLENAIDHLLSPDTDMDDNICEDLRSSKIFIAHIINDLLKNLYHLLDKILRI